MDKIKKNNNSKNFLMRKRIQIAKDFILNYLKIKHGLNLLSPISTIELDFDAFTKYMINALEDSNEESIDAAYLSFVKLLLKIRELNLSCKKFQTLVITLAELFDRLDFYCPNRKIKLDVWFIDAVKGVLLSKFIVD